MLDMRKEIKSGRGKLAISTLILTLGLSGCSFSFNKDKTEANEGNKILIEYDIETQELFNKKVDNLLGWESPSDENINGELLEYTYLIDNSEETNATLACVTNEVTITSDERSNVSKREMTSSEIDQPVIQPIVIPKGFQLYGVESMFDLVESFGTLDVDCKKLVTLDGDTLYYFEGLFKFNKFAKQARLVFEDDEYMEAKVLYKLQDNGMWKELYRNQTGYMSDSKNVMGHNHNNTNEIVIPISETVFANDNGEYSEAYIKEALDTYSGKDDFYDEDNEGKDFSAYKKY